MKTATRIGTFLLAVSMLFAFAGCSKKVGTKYPDKTVGFQLEQPTEGEEIAVMHTSMGDIYLRFFPEAAPKAVENFKTHAQNGYYNGLTFHRVINDFMIQGGDPQGNGSGGESIWGGSFEDEFDSKLLNLRGALSMANSGENTNGSQFFINQATAEKFGGRESYAEEQIDLIYETAYNQYAEYYGASFTRSFSNWQEFKKANYQETYIYDWIPDEVWDLYEKTGGNISLDGAWRKTGGHTVFGQVFRGMEVVDAIAAVETDDTDAPTTAVTITSIELVAYTADMATA